MQIQSVDVINLISTDSEILLLLFTFEELTAQYEYYKYVSNTFCWIVFDLEFSYQKPHKPDRPVITFEEYPLTEHSDEKLLFCADRWIHNSVCFNPQQWILNYLDVGHDMVNELKLPAFASGCVKSHLSSVLPVFSPSMNAACD